MNNKKPINALDKDLNKNLASSTANQLLKSKVLVQGRPEILSCCEQLLANDLHWTGYFSYNNDSFLRDAVKYAPDVILMDLLIGDIAADEMIKKFKIMPELKNTVILTYYSTTSINRDHLSVQAQLIEVQYMKIVAQEAGAREYLGLFNPVTFLNIINVYRRDFNYII